MTLFITNANEFYLSIKKQGLLPSPFAICDNQLSLIVGFCNSKTPKTFLTKARKVKQFVKQFIKALGLTPFKVRFNLFGKGIASMYDNGKIVFCKDFLLKQPYLESVVCTLHEVAHALIWSNSDYQSLKKCDGVFLSDYVKNPSHVVVCPVEYYANLITLDWLQKTTQSPLIDQQKRQDLIKILQREKEKLLTAQENV